MNGLLFRTMVVVAILLATLVAAGYLAAHNVSLVSDYFPFMCVGLIAMIAGMVLETKIRLKQPLPPLPPLPSWEETKASMEHPVPVGKHVLLRISPILGVFLLFMLLDKLSPLCGVGIQGVLTVGVAIGCVADVRAIGRRHLPAKYIWMLTACSLLFSIGLIFMCGEVIRGKIAPTPLGP